MQIINIIKTTREIYSEKLPPHPSRHTFGFTLFTIHHGGMPDSLSKDVPSVARARSSSSQMRRWGERGNRQNGIEEIRLSYKFLRGEGLEREWRLQGMIMLGEGDDDSRRRWRRWWPLGEVLGGVPSASAFSHNPLTDSRHSRGSKVREEGVGHNVKGWKTDWGGRIKTKVFEAKRTEPSRKVYWRLVRCEGIYARFPFDLESFTYGWHWWWRFIYILWAGVPYMFMGSKRMI